MTQESFRDRYRMFRKSLLEFTPFVRRSRHRRALARLLREIDRLKECVETEKAEKLKMASVVSFPPPLACHSDHLVKVRPERLGDEVCFFVTHATRSLLKPYVVDHVTALVDSGISVVLIANTDAGVSPPNLPADLESRISGFFVRENLGFDFAAWAHAYCFVDLSGARRLYLINDSLAGPVDITNYQGTLERVRNSKADIVGLTENSEPQRHLQSFFLVLNERLLRSEIIDRFFRGIVNLPQKDQVIDCYETWLSPTLERLGFQSEAIFETASLESPGFHNATIHAWRELVELGFPFIKTAVLRDPIRGEGSRALLPSHYFDAI